jgi:hypothetical protein
LFELEIGTDPDGDMILPDHAVEPITDPPDEPDTVIMSIDCE